MSTVEELRRLIEVSSEVGRLEAALKLLRDEQDELKQQLEQQLTPPGEPRPFFEKKAKYRDKPDRGGPI